MSIEERLEIAENKLRRISDWCKAYPIDIFIEPDWTKVQELLGATLLTQVSAYNMRHVCEGIARIAEEDCTTPDPAPESPVLAPAEAQDGENIVPAPTDAPAGSSALPVSLVREIERMEG